MANELIKVKNNLSLEIMKEILVLTRKWNLQFKEFHLAQKNIQATQYGIENVSDLGAKLWNLLSGEMNDYSSLTVSKYKLRNFYFNLFIQNYNPSVCNLALIGLYTFL